LGNHPLQASLSPNERLKHLKRKFRAERKIVSQKSILLIDDVITSGASITGTTLALLEAGAAEIDVISICRSDLFSSLRHSLAKKSRENTGP
jgi:predicted amidophosphoribosyltransferase